MGREEGIRMEKRMVRRINVGRAGTVGSGETMERVLGKE